MMEILGVGGDLGVAFFLSAKGGLFAGKITFFLAANLAISVFKLWRSYILFLYLSLSFTFTSKTFLQFLSSCSLSFSFDLILLSFSLSLPLFLPYTGMFPFRSSTFDGDCIILLFLLPLFLAHKYTHTHTQTHSVVHKLRVSPQQGLYYTYSWTHSEH